jgi:hypothetical protein
MLTGRHDFQAELLLDGRVLVAGGEGVSRFVELYDPATGTWTETGALPEGGSGFFTTTLLSDGTVLAFGRFRNSWNGETWSERYDPRTGTWSPTAGGGPPEGSGTLLQDGRVLVLSGRDAYLFDPDGVD